MVPKHIVAKPMTKDGTQLYTDMRLCQTLTENREVDHVSLFMGRISRWVSFRGETRGNVDIDKMESNGIFK